MLKEKVYFLANDKTLYNDFYNSLRNNFNEFSFYLEEKKLTQNISDLLLDDKFENNNLFILFIEYPYLSYISDFLSKNINESNYIVVGFYNKNISMSPIINNIFDLINTNSMEFDNDFFFSKLNNEVINKNRISLLEFEVKQYYEIGKSLSTEKDTFKLLDMIIDSSMELTSSDAGTIYLVLDKNTKSLSYINHDSYDDKLLNFAIAKNKSIDINLEATTSKLTKESIFGYSVITGKSLKIDDAYNICSDLSYKHNQKFDLKTGYITKSILSIPMKDNNNNVIGVIQLINKKKNKNIKIDYSSESCINNIIPYHYSDELIMNSLASQAAVALSNNLLYNDMQSLLIDYKEQNKHLSLISRKLLKAHEDERRRIAREIHDGAAQSCSNSSIRLEICKKLFKSNNYDKFEHELDVLGNSIKDTLKEIRTIIYDLKPSYLEDGLISSVKNHIDIFKETTGLNIDFNHSGNDDLVEYYLTSTLYRIIQESLSNINKHAFASKVNISIHITNKNISLIISDNGKGFDINKIEKGNKSLQGGFGLEGITERVHLVKGDIILQSEIGNGTKINIEIPL